MPRYTYLCEACGEHFEVIHSMMASQDNCLLCESENIKKVPTQIANKLTERTQKVGDIVRDHIKMSKEELKKDKISSKKEL
tara:strand:+ start:1425 stop:1667 length:243 start_codon:yes stop_codon:yes gene_type:complete